MRDLADRIDAARAEWDRLTEVADRAVYPAATAAQVAADEAYDIWQQMEREA